MPRWISIRWFVLTLAVCGKLQGADRNDIDFPELLKIAERYDLPLPPEKAPLILAYTDRTTLTGDSSTSHDPGIYRPAFLLEKLPNGQARVLMGWNTTVVSTDADHRPSTRPYSLQPQQAKPKGYVLECNNMSSFVTALQLAQRSEMEKAKDIWEQVNAAEYFETRNAGEDLGEYRANPQVLLAHGLYLHLYEAVLPANADMKTILKKLFQLKREYPDLFSDDEDLYYPYRRTRFVRDLGLTIAAETAPEGSVEALLIGWGNQNNKFWHLGFFDDHNIDSARPAREIFLMGAKVFPELNRLSKDQRLTRQLDWAFVMRRPAERIRLGQLATQLSEVMAGSQKSETATSLGKQKGWEKEFFEKAAVDLENRRISGFHEVPLWILGQKYPQSLMTICSKIPSRASRDARLFELAETVANSKLTSKEKTEALVGMSERLSDYSRKRSVLQQLARVNEERCIELLQPVLAQLPKDVNETYWTCEAAGYTHVVMQLQNDRIWKDYLEVAKHSAVGLRMEIMDPMNYSYIKDENRNRRLAFLASFLDDTEIRDPSIDAAKYEGPCAAFTFGKITVRDFAAMKIASVLDLEERPDEFWTQDQWSQLRQRVRTALNREDLPTLTP
ncbi:hypothetical protein Mal52_08190 [Symmachiella dynata]|uniref:Uncharacterized protein n=2 Tax=Symmachiella dynata TaxID=2527995 RepID=A0A517ZIV5_9PLAN|nr:hypothetical protein Mal52_08190 [Symmachiella dynata]